MSKTWEVVVWVGRRAERREFSTKDQAYLWANENAGATAIEVYGPNGEYDAA